jgi:hypothetical protein
MAFDPFSDCNGREDSANRIAAHSQRFFKPGKEEYNVKLQIEREITNEQKNTSLCIMDQR